MQELMVFNLRFGAPMWRYLETCASLCVICVFCARHTCVAVDISLAVDVCPCAGVGDYYCHPSRHFEGEGAGRVHRVDGDNVFGRVPVHLDRQDGVTWHCTGHSLVLRHSYGYGGSLCGE
jgi:hypothetical protein